MKYVKLEDIAELFLEGRGVVVFEHPTNQGYTVKTIVSALARIGHFDEQVEFQNLKNIQDNLEERGINVKSSRHFYCTCQIKHKHKFKWKDD